VKFILAIVLALSAVACGENGIETVLTGPSPSPSPATVQTVNAICDTQITGLTLDIDLSGPHLLIEVFASSPSPVEIEIEEYLSDGHTIPVTRLSNVVGRTSVPLHFNTKYRGRARAGTCAWSPWVTKQIGPANPCGDCVAAPPPPPPPPPPTEDDGCMLKLDLRRMEGPPPDQGCKEQ
jgi:hypothetical protein